MAYQGIKYLRKKLSNKTLNVDKRYRYYEMKTEVNNTSQIEPKGFSHLQSVLGWTSKAVDSLADRIIFREFENDNFRMNDIFKLNNQDIFVDNAILSALITSCSFIYISQGEDGPRLQVIDGGHATGEIDPTTNLLTEGYAVLSTDSKGKPIDEAYFTKEEIIFYRNGKEFDRKINPAPYPLLVPIIYRPDAKRPFGRSRISRACMAIQKGAMRTIHRSEISSEFYSFPQKYVLGTSQESETLDSFKAAISMMLEFTKDEDGDKPTVGQFTQQSMSPYIDQVEMYAKLFAGETGLSLDDIGFVTDNPSSAEAIKASHENLRLVARKAQRDFSKCLINVGYLAVCLRDNQKYKRSEVLNTSVKFEPIFEPDMSTISLVGDGAIKINQAVPGYFNKNNLYDLTGVKSNDNEETNIFINEDILNKSVLDDDDE